MPFIVLISGALTSDVSRGSRLDVPSSFPAFWHIQGRLVGRLQKERWDRCLFPYHVFRDPCVRWGSVRCIKCPGSRARVRRRTVSLRSTPLDSLEPASVFDGSWRSSPDRFARRYFRLRGRGRRWLRVCTYGWCRYMYWWGYPLLILSTLGILNTGQCYGKQSYHAWYHALTSCF
jgi:hypothetical protein